VRHGQAALSGSQPKAPGSAGGYLLNPAVNLADQPTGFVARLDQVYDLVEGNIGSEIRAKISAISKELEHPLAQPVAKVILPAAIRQERSPHSGEHCGRAPSRCCRRLPARRCNRFPPVIIQRAIWLYARFTLSFRDVEDLLAERGIIVSYETVRRWVKHFGSMIAADLRRRRPKPHSTWHLDEVFIKIDGQLVYLWRAVDAEGEVLDVLVQKKRDKRAAVKLMRKLCKKIGFVPDKLVTDDLRSDGAAARDLGISPRHERGRWRNIDRKIRISRPDEGSARCRDSRVRGRPSDFCPSTPLPTTLSTSSAT